MGKNTSGAWIEVVFGFSLQARHTRWFEEAFGLFNIEEFFLKKAIDSSCSLGDQSNKHRQSLGKCSCAMYFRVSDSVMMRTPLEIRVNRLVPSGKSTSQLSTHIVWAERKNLANTTFTVVSSPSYKGNNSDTEKCCVERRVRD